MRFALAVVWLAACGGNGGGGGDARSDTPEVSIDAPDPSETSCFDGLDDDHNGVADCAEPSCAPFAACVPELPAGWDGYAALYDGTAAPTCPGVFTSTLAPGNVGLTAAAASCTACACGAASGGACPASGGVATVPPATWATTAVACEGSYPDATGCTGTDSCQPKVGAPFHSGTCIHQIGDMACPAQTVFTERHVFYAGLFDTRGCAACTCGTPSGNACASGGGGPSGSAMQLQPSTYCCIP